jgi:hypothetical protein
MFLVSSDAQHGDCCYIHKIATNLVISTPKKDIFPEKIALFNETQ